MKKFVLFLVALAGLALWLITQTPSNTEKKATSTPEAAEEPQRQVQEPRGPEPQRQRAEQGRTADVQRYELPVEALQDWRDLPSPHLYLFSHMPLLATPPEILETDAEMLARKGSAEELADFGYYFSPNPTLLSEQTVRMALREGLLSGATWVLPTSIPFEQLSAEVLRQQLEQSGMMSAEEAASLTKRKGAFQATVEGKPFRIVTPSEFSDVQGNAVLLIDLSYFQDLYLDEVKTPSYGLIHSLAEALRPEMERFAFMGISHSTLEGAVPLTMRFMGERLAALLETPALLDQEPPPPWRLHADILYRNSFMQKEHALNNYLLLTEKNPQSAIFNYGLYQTYRVFKHSRKAFESLDRAVELDPGYGFEYITLLNLATEAKDWTNAKTLLDKAREALPPNYYLDMLEIKILIGEEKNVEALKKIGAMKEAYNQNFYHADLVSNLIDLESEAAIQTSLDLLRSVENEQ